MALMDLAVAAIRLLPAETAHHVTVELAARFGALLPGPPKDDPRLAVKVLGLDFSNPLGMAAGFDKDSRAYRGMLKMGLGHIECGTVTPRPQAGNPKPRMYRLPEDGAVINRMGFNNRGMEASAAHLARRKRGRGIVGINIGANKDSTDRIADYLAGYRKLAPLADYVAVNVSSPNTPGLRELQEKRELETLLSALVAARGEAKTPILVKIAPDLDEAGLDDIAEAVLASGIEGMIVTNTMIARPPTLKSRYASQSGGLSGKPLLEPSTQVLAAMRRRLGAKIVLIGVGGVSSGEDVYRKIRAGAALVQLYTALVYHGGGLIPKIKRELLALLARDGLACLADAVGADLSSS